MEYPPTGSGDVFGLLSSSGARSEPDEGGFVTCTVATFLFPLGGSSSPLHSVQILTDATTAGVFTVETCNFPNIRGAMGGGATDATDFDVTGSIWVKEDPTTAYVATVGTGWTVVNLTLTKTAGVGSALIHLGNIGSRRCRLKYICSTGGKVRVNRWGKA